MSLGQRIARLRQEHAQTLQEVANGAGLTPSFLSRLERDQVNISVNNLRKLAQFFSVPMTFFFEGEEQGSPVAIVRAGGRPQLTGSRPELEVYALTPALSPLDARLIVAAPGSSATCEGAPILLVLAGQLRCQVGGESHTLDAGDTLALQRAASLQWESVGGEPATIAIVRSSGEAS